MSRFNQRVSIGVSALLGCGLQWSTPVCQAQTAPTLAPVIERNPLATDDAQGLTWDQKMELQRILCAQPIDLKLKDATISDVVAQARIAMPNADIELRLSAEDKALQRRVDEKKVKLEATKLPTFRLELEQIPLGEILQSAATLAGYDFFITPDKLLVTQPKQLTPQERGQVRPWNTPIAASPQAIRPQLDDAERAQGSLLTRQASQLVARQLLESKLKGGATTIEFGDLAPELQRQLQTAVNFKNSVFGSTP